MNHTMTILGIVLLFILSVVQREASAFVATVPPTTAPTKTTTTPAKPRFSFVLYASESSSSNSDSDDDENWQIALRQRQLSFQQKKDETRKRWMIADCQQSLVGVPDWVRRVSVQWPLVACGSANGDVYVIQCESGKLIGKGESTEDQRRYADVPLGKELATTLKQLYGDFDGGGTLAIGFSWNNVIAHAGRTGGVELWGMDTSSPNLISLGKLLDEVLVTTLEWAQDDLWIGTQDGRILVYTFDEKEVPTTPSQEWKNIGGTILSISFHEELDVAVATTSNGVVELLTMDDPDCRRSFYPPFDSGRMRSNAFALCAVIVEHAHPDDNNRHFSIACGGNDGSLYLQPLRLLEDTIDPELDLDRPFSDLPMKALAPHHRGPCKCLAAPIPGILVSGGQDGTVRVWDLNAKEDKDLGLYLLSGFKVWMGSLWSDGERLVMDGSDNAISILNFGEGRIETKAD